MVEYTIFKIFNILGQRKLLTWITIYLSNQTNMETIAFYPSDRLQDCRDDGEGARKNILK